MLQVHLCYNMTSFLYKVRTRCNVPETAAAVLLLTGASALQQRCVGLTSAAVFDLSNSVYLALSRSQR
jgi:hypothetical protein